MLKIILGFLPWILYSSLVGSSPVQNEIAIVTTLAVLFVFNYKELRKGFILTWGACLFFIVLLICTFVFQNNWLDVNANLLSNLILTGIVWLSLIIGKPFTLQYAREQTPEAYWQKPGFILVNQILTAVWGAALLVGTIAVALHTYQPGFNGWSYQITSYLPIIFAIWITKKFPAWYRQRAIAKKSAIDNKNNPYLQGNYAPVHDELTVSDLSVEGKIPTDLNGVYMRNGPNPAFSPISYTYPLDGDGMLHAVYLQNGKAIYRNRFVETKGLLAERRVGRAIYSGVAMPMPVDPKLIGEGGDPGPIKDSAFIHIIRHAQQYLAMWESGPAYEVTQELQTVGEWYPKNGKQPFNVNAHTRLDPVSGELAMITYDMQPPYLTYYVLDQQGVLIKQLPIEKPNSTMMHDFALTKNYAVFFDCPIIFDLAAAEAGGEMLQWRPELGTRIGLLDRNNDQIIWLTTGPFFVYHFANAYEENGQIIVDYIRHQEFSLIKKPNLQPPVLYRTTIDLMTKQISHKKLDDKTCEFPRINDNFNALAYRYIYMPMKLGQQYNALMKYDLAKQTSSIHEFGESFEIGEAVFAPRAMGIEEDDGYIMLFVYNKIENKSDFVILDAKDFTAKPIAKIKLPRRVPHGLHGSWMPQE